MNAALVGSLGILLFALVAVLSVAARRRNWAAVVNAGAALAVAIVASLAALGFQFNTVELVTPTLALWATVAGLVHAIGMLGPYDSVWWWDHVTHTLSAALLAALVYGALVVTVGATWSTGLVAAATVAYIVLAGVFWELLEIVARAVGERYGIGPILVPYGRRDTALDLVFDVVGAVFVVALDIRVFVSLFDAAPEVTRLLLRWSAVALLAGTGLIGVALVWRSGQTA